MPKMEEQKITRQQLENASRTSTGVRGYFAAYCALHSCCEKCNRWVRLLCRVKCKIEELQNAIILRVCKEAQEQMPPLKIAFVAWNAEATDTYLQSLAVDNGEQVKRYDRSRGRIILKDGTEIRAVHDRGFLDGLYFDQVIVADDWRRRTLYVCRDLLNALDSRTLFSNVPEEYRYQLYDIGQEAPRDGYI